MRAPLVALIWVCGCVSAKAVPCEFGTCPGGLACDTVHDRCVLPDQLESCAGRPDDDECTAGKQPGVCVDGVCLVRGCGDFRVNGSEQCDGDRFLNDAADCADVGFYGNGAIACNDDCTIDDSMCEGLGFCGDGVVDTQHEACDFLAAQTTTTCASLGYYAGDSASCTAACTYRTEGVCSQRCGDGMINGPEVCEPTIAVPESVACVDYGFDAGGLSCASTCNADLAACRFFGLHTLGVTPANGQGIYAVGPQEAFIVGFNGSSGYLWHWSGSGSTEIAMVGVGLNGVGGSSASDVYAVGGSGKVLHWDGATLTTMTTPTSNELQAIDVLGPGVAVAGGFNTVLALSGSTWSELPAPVSGTVYDIDATAVDDIWVADVQGIHHWDGATWTQAAAAVSVCNAIWRSGSHVYAACYDGEVAHFDGTTWEVLPLSVGEQMTGVWGSSSSDVLVTGEDGSLFHYNGLFWRALDVPSSLLPYPIRIDGTDASNALLVGQGRRVTHWQGAGWAFPFNPPGAAAFSTAWGTADDLYVAAGDDLMHFDGQLWQSARSGTGTLAVFAFADDDMFIADSGGVWHYDGVSWSPETLPDDFTSLTELTGAGGIVWGTAKGGEVLRRSTDGTWTVSATFSARGLWAASATDVWAVEHGYIHHYNGVSWSDQQVLNEELIAIWGSAADDIYAVGDGGDAMHYDGTSWTSLTLPTTRNLVAVHGTSKTDVFVVGEDAMLHYDGARWSPIRPGPTNVGGVWATTQDVHFFDRTTHTVETLARSCPTCL